MKTVKLFLAFSLLLTHFLIASIEIQETKGLYDCFQNNKAYLSPFNGIVWSKARLPEKFYRFGNAEVTMGISGGGRNIPVVKEIVGGDYNIQLALNLFYALGSEFGPSTAPSNPTAYLSPEHIGKLITLMDKASEKLDANEFKTTFKAILIDAVDPKKITPEQEIYLKKVQITLNNLKSFLENPEFTEIFEKQKTAAKLFGQGQIDIAHWANQIINEKKQNIDNLFKRLSQDDQKKAAQALNSIQEAKNMLETPQIKYLIETLIHHKRSASQEQAIREISNLATIVIGALKESGNIKSDSKQKYIFHTPYFLFLALLYEKAQNINDLYLYCKNLPQEYLKENWRELIQNKFESDKTIAWVEDSFGTFQDDPSRQKFIDENYANLCYAEIQGQIQRNALPPFSRYPEISYSNSIGKISFTPCVEIAIYNWTLVLITQLGLYDKTTQTFKIENLSNFLKTLATQKQIQFDENKLGFLKNFFEKYPKAIPLDKETIIEWSKIVSNIPGIKYYQAKKLGLEPIKEKDYNTTMVHLEPNISDINTYGKNVKAMDKTFYLYEAAGVPSTYVHLTNHLMGLQFKNFKEICEFFKLSGKDLENIKDEELYEKQKSHIDINLKGVSGESSFNIYINFTKGHSIFINLGMKTTKENDRAALETNLRDNDGIVKFIITNFDKNFINQNLEALYLNISSIDISILDSDQSFFSYFYFIKKSWENTSYLMQQFLLSSNLLNMQTPLFILNKFPYLKPIILKKLLMFIKEKNSTGINFIFNEYFQDLFKHFDSEIIKKLNAASPAKQTFLRNRGLTSIPQVIFSLTELEELDLGYNKLTNIPEQFAELQKLKQLNLSSNKLTDLPEQFAKLKELKHLNLSLNPFLKTPKVLIKMWAQFESLQLPDNCVVCTILEALQFLPKLFLENKIKITYGFKSPEERKHSQQLLISIFTDLWINKEQSKYYSPLFKNEIFDYDAYCNFITNVNSRNKYNLIIDKVILSDFFEELK